MPELPEVETIRRDLEKVLIGHSITAVDLKDERLMSAQAIQAFLPQILGQRWISLGRHGKYLWAQLENKWRIVFHLRMTGQLVLERSQPSQHRLWMRFENGTYLSFYDQRRFGEIKFLKPGDLRHSVSIPGPDALNELDLATFQRLLKGRTTKIQPLLLDQRCLAGLGNIYAQEALFQASIRPSRPTKRISQKEIKNLFTAVKETLEKAIERRGSSSRNYRDGYGNAGSAQQFHAVYRKGGKPCPRCKNPLRAIRIGGRGTVYCPRCQK